MVVHTGKGGWQTEPLTVREGPRGVEGGSSGEGSEQGCGGRNGVHGKVHSAGATAGPAPATNERDPAWVQHRARRHMQSNSSSLLSDGDR
jgi:hypothetical protein